MGPQAEKKLKNGIAGEYRPPSADDLHADHVFLWHGTSVNGGRGILRTKGLKEGPRGVNASAIVENAAQYPEDTGAQFMVLLKADTKSLSVDPNDQIGDTVEDGLFSSSTVSAATVGHHNVAAVFDVRHAGDDAMKALQSGDFHLAMRLGAVLAGP